MTIFNKDATLQAVLLYFCILSVTFIFYIIDTPVMILLAFFSISFIVSTMHWISIGRIITLNGVGMEISFLGIKKFYPWNCVLTKHFYGGDSRPGLGYRIQYTHGVVFSSKKNRCPSWLHPMQYCVMFQPFSYVVLNFPNSKPVPKHCLPVYEIDKESLIQLLNEFKVDLKTVRTGDGSKPLKK